MYYINIIPLQDDNHLISSQQRHLKSVEFLRTENVPRTDDATGGSVEAEDVTVLQIAAVVLQMFQEGERGRRAHARMNGSLQLLQSNGLTSKHTL